MTINEWTDEQKAFQRRWLKALESGEYKQGVEMLRWDDGSYCCLGVALDVRPIPPGSNDKWVQDDGGFFVYETYTDPSTLFCDTNLPPHICNELGLSVAMQHVAIYANDLLLWDFKRIAEVFRRYFLRPQLSSVWLHQDDLKKILDVHRLVQGTIEPDPPILD